MGLKFDSKNPLGSDFKVIYHDVIGKESTSIEMNNDKVGIEYPPLTGEYKLFFEKKKSYISVNDYRFESIVKDDTFSDKIGYDKNGEIEKALGIPLGNTPAPMHQIGGYPYFTQWDPRDSDVVREMEKNGNEFIVLFQIDTQYDRSNKKEQIIFGDCGVMNFFIRKNDLKNKDFSKVLYNWDCS